MKKFLKIIFGISVIPFIIPLILKGLILIHCFADIDEFQKITNIFYNYYSIAYIIIALVLLSGCIYKWNIKDMFKNMRTLKLKVGNIEASLQQASEEIKEDEDKKKIIDNLDNLKLSINENGDSKNTKQVMKKQLSINNNEVILQRCEKCKIKEVENENKNLKYFAAYNLINMETKKLLNTLYKEKSVDVDDFRNKIIDGYERRNKHNVKFSKKDINKVANSKYETIYKGLRFLNIIEPSEDDKNIKLTMEGKEFVKNYI